MVDPYPRRYRGEAPPLPITVMYFAAAVKGDYWWADWLPKMVDNGFRKGRKFEMASSAPRTAFQVPSIPPATGDQHRVYTSLYEFHVLLTRHPAVMSSTTHVRAA